MRASFVDVGGIRTRYLHAGDGPPLLLIHGLGISADCWFDNVDVLAQNFSVFALDMLGHGFTAFRDLEGRAAQPVMMEHVAAFTDTLGLDTYAACGSSYGAGVSALLYLQCPERMTKLVLVGSGSTFRPPEAQEEGFGKSYENATSALRNPTFENYHTRLANVCYDPSSVTDAVIFGQLTSYAQDYILPAYEQIAHANMDIELTRPHRLVGRLEQIKLPTLILVGREDPRSSVDFHIAGHKRMPNAELVIYEKCGHMPMIEHIERFNQTVSDFLLSA